MSIKNALATLTDYVERSTHWQEGGATRHDAKTALQSLPDDIEWLEKGIAEWRQLWKCTALKSNATEARLRIAVRHLQAVLNGARTHAEQQAADVAARDWLTSIGSEP